MLFRAFLIGLGSVLLINSIRRFLTTSTRKPGHPNEPDQPPDIDPDRVRDADFRDLHS